MKSTTVLASLGFSVASAATMRRQAQPALNQYNVTGFSAGCVPHSVMCNYQFTVTNGQTATSTNCQLQLQGPDMLPSVPDTQCENTAFTWSAKADGGEILLTVSVPFSSRSNLTGQHTIASNELQLQNGGSVVTQRYVGPQDFILPFTGNPQ